MTSDDQTVPKCKKKKDEPFLFLPMLITATTGCRISELIALKFTAVNFNTCEIQIQNQLGRPLDVSNLKPGNYYKQTVKTKSKAGERKNVLPDFVVDEIVMARERYEVLKRADPKFHDDDYIWHQENGMPYGRDDYQDSFQRLKEKLNLPENFHWHDLRHVFATIMILNKVNLKALSVALDHYDELFTLNTYTDADAITSYSVPEYDEIIDEVLPTNTPEVIECHIPDSIMDSVLPIRVA